MEVENVLNVVLGNYFLSTINTKDVKRVLILYVNLAESLYLKKVIDKKVESIIYGIEQKLELK